MNRISRRGWAGALAASFATRVEDKSPWALSFAMHVVRHAVRLGDTCSENAASSRPRTDGWMRGNRLKFKLGYLNGDQNSPGATSDSLAKVAVGTIGIVSTEKVPKLLPSKSFAPEVASVEPCLR